MQLNYWKKDKKVNNKSRKNFFHNRYFLSFRKVNPTNNKINQIKRNNDSFLKIIHKKNDVDDEFEIKTLTNENFIDSHIDTINKVEDLIKKMEKRKRIEIEERSSIKKPGRKIFSKNDNVDINVMSHQPIQINGVGNEKFNMNSNLLNNSYSGTEMIQDERVNSEGSTENISTLELSEEIDYSIFNEMHAEKNKRSSTESKSNEKEKWLKSGLTGFDKLLKKGIPKGSNIIIAGGPGSGKTIFCLQVLYNKALEGYDCVFLSMEERPDKLKEHMIEFGFDVEEISRNDEQIIIRAKNKGRISLRRLQPLLLARSIEALLEKASGSLPIELDLVLDFIPEGFNSCLLTLDSISAIETAFSGTTRQYRIYIEQLFRYFENLDITTFMITESSNAPKKFSNTGVEEFLADGIFVFYNFQGIDGRTRGIEIFKLRGASHSQIIAQFTITNKGIIIDPSKSCM